MKILPHLRKAQDGHAHAAGQDVEGHKLANSENAVDNKIGPQVEYRDGNDLGYELHRLACDVAEAEHAKARVDITGELLFPLAVHLWLDRHCLKRLDARDA